MWNNGIYNFIALFKNIGTTFDYIKNLLYEFNIQEIDIQSLIHLLEGLKGESIFRDFLVSHKIEHFQVDIIAKNKNNKYILFEIKHQERFSPPPFEGHGLPEWQINARLNFYKETSIEPYLIVVDKNTNIIYYNSILELEKGESYITTRSRRKIYPLSSFKILQYKGENECLSLQQTS